MTARANSVTARATPPEVLPGGRWSMPSTDVRVFLNALAGLSYDVGSLLRASGIQEAQLNDADARVSCEALGAMIAFAQRERFTPNLGLELARVTPIGAYPLLDYLVATSDTVGAGVEQLAKYLHLVGTPAQVTIHQDERQFRIQIAEAADPVSTEYCAAIMVRHFGTETDGRFTATRLHLRHTPDDVNAFARAVGCDVCAGSSWSGLVVPPDSWALPLRRRDSSLRRLLETQADQILAQLPERTGLAEQVQRALTRHLDAGSRGVDAVARQLAMSSRTLQRRLASEGVSYQQLLDAARKEAARRYLAEPTLAIGEVAYLVGYSEPAPFHRAFKRWYGVTPDVFRRNASSPSSPR